MKAESMKRTLVNLGRDLAKGGKVCFLYADITGEDIEDIILIEQLKSCEHLLFKTKMCGVGTVFDIEVKDGSCQPSDAKLNEKQLSDNLRSQIELSAKGRQLEIELIKDQERENRRFVADQSILQPIRTAYRNTPLRQRATFLAYVIKEITK